MVGLQSLLVRQSKQVKKDTAHPSVPKSVHERILRIEGTLPSLNPLLHALEAHN